MFQNMYVQCDPNQNALFQMTIILKLSGSDPMLVKLEKLKLIWEAAGSILKIPCCSYNVFKDSRCKILKKRNGESLW